MPGGLTRIAVKEFVWPVRVYYEDTDAGGVVYYANYLRFMERARTEWLRALGFEQDRVRAEHGVIFIVRHAELDYRLPAHFNDALELVSRIDRPGRASLTFHQQVRRPRDQALLCVGRIKVASVDAERMRPVALPPSLAQEFFHAE